MPQDGVRKVSVYIQIPNPQIHEYVHFYRLKLKIEACPEIGVWTKECKLMLIIEGPSISAFAEGTLLSNGTKRVATLPSKKSSLHYTAAKKTLIAIVEEDLTESGEISELLLDLCKPLEVITLTIKPKVDYKSENIASIRDEITFIRSIDGELNNVEKLDTPNFIAGVAAGSKLLDT